MGIFGDNVDNSPITAQLLRDIISERRVGTDDEDVIRYNKILHHILNRVRYNPDEDIWEHRTSLIVIGITSNPFTSEFADKINNMVRTGASSDDIVKWINERGIEPCDRLKRFVKYFKDRGFTVYFRTADYIKSKDRIHDRLITITWEEKNNI